MRWRLPREAYRAHCTRINDPATACYSRPSLVELCVRSQIVRGTRARMTSKRVIGNTGVGAGHQLSGEFFGHDVQPVGHVALWARRVPSMLRGLNATSTSLVPRESRATSRASFWGHRAAAQRDFRGPGTSFGGPAHGVYREGNAKHTSKIRASPDPTMMLWPTRFAVHGPPRTAAERSRRLLVAGLMAPL